MNEHRKLAAIMFTDIVGFTALMSRDEDRALQILQRSRKIIREQLGRHNGELLDTIGDGTLSSFASAVDSAACALAIQRMAQQYDSLSLRVGIHIGDVIVEEGEIYGDGVNVASRLEPLAEPGGICVSDLVYRNIRNRPGIEAVFLGEKQLKNVDLPMRIYALTGEGVSSPGTEIISAEDSGLGVPICKTISNYHIVEKLGEGGMGVVYKAEDTRLKRIVALKFLRSDVLGNQEQQARFVNEAQSGAAIDHANICTIHEIGRSEGHTFIAMAYVDGQNLRERISAAGKLAIDEALDTVVQISQGLGEAHARGIVHRDVKSANVMITARGQVKITDFGLAKIEGNTLMTREGMALGTVSYMSPEQARGEKVDHRTDIWSVGVMLYEMLTGTLPFEGDNGQAVMFSILHDRPRPVCNLRGEVSRELDRIVCKALEKDREQRYQSVAALQDDLLRLKVTPAGVTDAGSSASLKRIFRGRSLLRAIARPAVVLALVALAVIAWPTLRQWSGIEPVPQQKHLLVLPFTNVGQEPANQAFCDGLVEMLASKLTQMEQFQGALWIVPAVDVRSSRVTSASSARDIFNVNLAVSGSMQRLGDGFRLTISLIDTESLRQLRSEVITDQMTNIARLQDGIMDRLAEMLEMELRPEERQVLATGQTIVPGAYEFYLQGLGYLQDYEQADNIDTAMDLFERAIELDSFYALAYAGLGEACWRKYEGTRDSQWVDPALINCQRAAELSSLCSQAHLVLGMVYQGTGRYEDAVMELQLALELNPSSAAAYRQLAGAYAGRGRLLEAELTYQRAIELNPTYWAGYSHLGFFYYQQARWQDAIGQFQHVIELSPLNARGYSNLGGIFVYLRRWDEAEELFRRSVELEPDYVGYSNLATMYFHQRRYAESAQMYEKLIELGASDYRMWANLASSCYWAPGERDRSWIIYQRAVSMAVEELEINPTDPEVLVDLATYYAMLRNRTQALAHLQRVIDLQPEIQWVIFAVGHTYEILGERELALNWIEKAMRRGYTTEEVEQMPIFEDLCRDERYGQMISRLAVRVGQ